MEWSSTEQAITHVALTKNPRGLRNFAPLSLVICTASEVGVVPPLSLRCPGSVWLPADWRAGLPHVSSATASTRVTRSKIPAAALAASPLVVKPTCKAPAGLYAT